MLRIPPEKYNLPKFEDEDVIRSWKWFMSFISEQDWQRRKAQIERKIAVEFRDTQPFSEPLTEGMLVVIKDDVIGWYLYLIDMLINEPHKYEFFQGARAVPIFKRLGVNLDLLQDIGGIEKKVKELIKKRKSEADALLFEILTALLWARNGYQVAFLAEKEQGKTPDIIAKKDGKTWSIECKRQSKTSDYTYRETAKRQKMVSYINRTLLERNILLNIVFHAELHTLPDTFLKDQVGQKLKLSLRGKIVSNEQVDIDMTFVDIPSIKRYLENNSVKHNSPMLNALVGRKPVDNKAFTCGIYANFFRVGEGEVNNLFVSDIINAYGVYWSCDANEAIWAKARDIKNQIYSAMQQFDSESTAVIHIGMETFDGPKVEMTRFEKIKGTITKIPPQDTKLRWVFCNFFQSYSLPDQCWVFDETASTMSPYISPKSPLEKRLMIVPEDEDTLDNIPHWDRPLP
jgi:Holliday junction resolvase